MRVNVLGTIKYMIKCKKIKRTIVIQDLNRCLVTSELHWDIRSDEVDGVVSASLNQLIIASGKADTASV